MIMRKALLVGLVLLVFRKSRIGSAPWNLTGDYSYMHYEPVDNLPTANIERGRWSQRSFISQVFWAQGGSGSLRQPKR